MVPRLGNAGQEILKDRGSDGAISNDQGSAGHFDEGASPGKGRQGKALIEETPAHVVPGQMIRLKTGEDCQRAGPEMGHAHPVG